MVSIENYNYMTINLLGGGGLKNAYNEYPVVSRIKLKKHIYSFFVKLFVFLSFFF